MLQLLADLAFSAQDSGKMVDFESSRTFGAFGYA